MDYRQLIRKLLAKNGIAENDFEVVQHPNTLSFGVINYKSNVDAAKVVELINKTITDIQCQIKDTTQITYCKKGKIIV
jgi:conjugal transfer/entry exclusion protein